MMDAEVMGMTTIATMNPLPALRISAPALARARALIAEAGNPALKLRIAVAGGGCSGFQYDIRLDAARAPDDIVLDHDGVECVTDPQSLEYLAGAEVDFIEQLAGAHFIVHNPNAKTTCGCGSSFTA